MKTDCDDVKTLLASYLDGELTEEQSSPLRAHLLACSSCRETMQEGKVIRRWFTEANEPVEVPQGFAAHVARRAFAGDPGLMKPAPAQESKPLLTFVFALSAAAAVLLFTFSLFIQKETLPQKDRLDATEQPFWIPVVDEALDDASETELETDEEAAEEQDQ